MTLDKASPRRDVILASLAIGAALVICSLILARAAVRIKGMGKVIRVTGAAFQPIRSDFAIWEGSFSVQSLTIEQGYDQLAGDLDLVKSFFGKAGFGEDQYEIGTVRISKTYNRDREITGYVLSQTIKLELADVDRISIIAKETSTLIRQGVMMESRPPRFLFTGLDTLKIEMIGRATENAKLRAKRLAETTGREIGPPTSASVGVFQIRPLHSQEVKSYGVSDVSSIDKEIVSTVHVSFLIE